MKEKELLGEIDKTVTVLYQNREKEAVEMVMRLLETFQIMMKEQTEEQIEQGGAFALLLMRELLDAYQKQDMLGMADCLMEKAVLWTRFYFQKNE